MTIVYALMLQPMPPMFPPGFIPHELVSIIQSFFVTIAVIALGIPIIRALTRRFVDRPPVAPAISADLHDRLERIEQAVDTVAIEVERISESQRYLTKLMAEPRALPGGGSGGASEAGSRKDGVR
jgi:hypothetical protein